MLVEHHMDLVMRVCDEITVLDFGRVIAARHARTQVRDDPAVLAAYLGDATSRAAGRHRAATVGELSHQLRPGAGPATDVTLHRAARGEITAVLGANGAGKTTLLRTHLRAASGRSRGSGRSSTADDVDPAARRADAGARAWRTSPRAAA